MEDARNYPPEAYAPEGTLWWQLKVAPGMKKQPFGDEQKIAAYLAYHLGEGAVFTIWDLRTALGEKTVPNNAEHLNRRMRTLRGRDGWSLPSARDERLGVDHYRIRKIGWHPGCGSPRPKNTRPSEKTRRKVFERDREICQVCGIASNEPYPDLPERQAKLTLPSVMGSNNSSRTASLHR